MKAVIVFSSDIRLNSRNIGIRIAAAGIIMDRSSSFITMSLARVRYTTKA